MKKLILMVIALLFSTGCITVDYCLDRIYPRTPLPIEEATSYKAYKDGNAVFMTFKYKDEYIYSVKGKPFNKIVIVDGDYEFTRIVSGKLITLKKEHIDEGLMRITYAGKTEDIEILYKKGTALDVPLYIIILPLVAVTEFFSYGNGGPLWPFPNRGR